MTQRPQVSVITATYNWSSVLRYAIESALWQTFSNFELLVIGDGCTDDSAEVVAAFGDPRVRWHNLESNSGHQSTPNNKGLELARGDAVAYLGHDDVWHPVHLERLVGALRETGADIGWSLTAQIGPPGSGVRLVRGVTPDGRYSPEASPPPSSLLHRRALVTEIGGWRNYRDLAMMPEEEFLRRAAQAGKRFVSVPELTVWKFPSSWRPGSYRDKPCQEQADCVRRIREEPDFLYREALDCTIALSLHKTDIVGGLEFPRPASELTPGWIISQLRSLRGLDPLETSMSSGAAGPAAPWALFSLHTYGSPLRRIGRKSKHLLRRILRAALRRLGA